jgi:hypothetical protein
VLRRSDVQLPGETSERIEQKTFPFKSASVALSPIQMPSPSSHWTWFLVVDGTHSPRLRRQPHGLQKAVSPVETDSNDPDR